jgi:DNA topoisomerase-1
MPQPLVIVESPAKAKTIAKFLGDDYVVESSIGHIRDLPVNAAAVPAAYKGEKWASLGVDVENDFKPLYVVSDDKKDQVRNLKKLLKNASELYLATDEDREGEAIAWHLLEVLNPKVPVRRMVFHEITKSAIQEAIDNPRELDRRLVDAQEARRILDRLYGYTVSPVLWMKILRGLSAGRVQSVATRIVVERERERMKFVAAEYWDLNASFNRSDADDKTKGAFGAKLLEVDNARVVSGKDFADTGELKNDGLVLLDAESSVVLADAIRDTNFEVRSVEPKPYRRRPAAPFITSTLQQEASRKLNFSSAQTMRSAQSLYEGGFITYMRTDSTTLSATALEAARSIIRDKYGEAFLPDEPRTYAKKVKNAQEAHEAIRPAGDTFQTPEEVAAQLPPGQARVYELIWKRTVASQMNDAVGETVTVRLGTTATDGRDVVFSASGTIITHPGYQKVYVEDTDDAVAKEDDRRLPAMAVGDALDINDLETVEHITQPPSRFTEASLVKRLEELGVGRPSTYASIMGTIQDRGYVWKKGSALVPSFTAFATVTLLEEHFPDLVDYAFTANMEGELDDIADGSGEMVPWLTRFYWGEVSPSEVTRYEDAEKQAIKEAKKLAKEQGLEKGKLPDFDSPDPIEGALGLKAKVVTRMGDIDARAINSIPIGADADGVPVVARVGKFGPYVARGEDTASIPDNLAPDELTVEKALEFIAAPSGDRELGPDPETGLMIQLKNGRFGPYVQVGDFEKDSDEKPKTASLFKSHDVATFTHEQALEILKLPRVVGINPEDGQEITALNGKFGPYLSKPVPDGKPDSRNLESEEQLLTITLDEAVKIYSQPKVHRGRAPKPPLRELGQDPETGLHMVIKDGRFGPYVYDGEDNASLRKGDDVETISIERASELLLIRRNSPKKKKKAKKKATKKKATKKTTAKKAAKKTASKKSTAKKTSTAKKKSTAKDQPSDGGAPDSNGAADTDDSF